MDLSKSDIEFVDSKSNSEDNLQKLNIINQKLIHDEKEKNEVIQSNCKSNETASSDITEKNIVVMDYTTGRQINRNLKYFHKFKIETVFSYNINISYHDIIAKFKEKLMFKIKYGKYVMNEKDAINLDKMIGLACTAMIESEKNNKQLNMRNIILETKFKDYNYMVKECKRVKFELDKLLINLCLALGRKLNEKEDVTHLINICAAMCARENEYQYILKENNELKYGMNKQLILVINQYDEILDNLDTLKQELEIKDLKISQLIDDINLLKTKKEQNGIGELFGGRITEFSDDLEGEYFDGILDDSLNRNELNEGKLLIAEEINQLVGSSDIICEIENYRMPDLINMFIKIIHDKADHLETINNNLSQNVEDYNQLLKEIDNYKEWQERLETENGRLINEIDNHKFDRTMFMSKEKEHNDLKKEYSQLQYAYDDVCKKYAQLKSLINQYKEQLAEKELNCADNDNIIKTLNLNLTKQTNKLKLTLEMHNNEKEKYKNHDSYVQKMVEEFTDRIQEKNVEIASIKDEYVLLKQEIYSAEEENQNLKHNIATLEYVLSERNQKNNFEQEKKKQRKQQSNLQFNDLLHVLSMLEQQMSIILDDMSTCKKKIVSYENVLHNMQNDIQQQSLTRDRWITKHENIKIEYNKLMENEMKKRRDTLLEHQIEVDNLKKNYNLKITSLVDTEKNLKLEIQGLKKNLNQKNTFITMAEKLSSLQLYNASNQINNLTRTSNTQTNTRTSAPTNNISTDFNSQEINEMKKHISIMQQGISKPRTTDTRFQLYRECSIDLMKKLKLQNKMLERQCKMYDEKIKYLENNGPCTKTQLRHFKF